MVVLCVTEHLSSRSLGSAFIFNTVVLLTLGELRGAASDQQVTAGTKAAVAEGGDRHFLTAAAA